MKRVVQMVLMGTAVGGCIMGGLMYTATVYTGINFTIHMLGADVNISIVAAMAGSIVGAACGTVNSALQHILFPTRSRCIHRETTRHYTYYSFKYSKDA